MPSRPPGRTSMPWRASTSAAVAPRHKGAAGRRAQAASSRGDPQLVTRGDQPPEAALLHGLPPVLAPTCRLVVLGSFPGQASLAAQQYYAHPRNQFWPLLGAIWGLDLMALAYPQRLEVALGRGLGIWDVYAACQRAGSLDSAIADARLNDLHSLRQRAAALQAVAHNGAEAGRALRRAPSLGLQVYALPSTSPAHASWSFDRKLEAWRSAFRSIGVA